MNQPIAPKVPEALLEKVFAKLGQIKSLKPWNFAEDVDLIGFRCPVTDQLGFVCIMGAAGLCQGLFIYRGQYGFSTFVATQNGMLGEGSEAIDGLQDGILAEFTERQFMEPTDLKTFKSLGLKFRGKTAWPFIRDIRPGHPAWFINENEARFLLSGLTALETAIPSFRENPDFPHGKDGKQLPLYTRATKDKWSYEFVKKSHFFRGRKR